MVKITATGSLRAEPGFYSIHRVVEISSHWCSRTITGLDIIRIIMKVPAKGHWLTGAGTFPIVVIVKICAAEFQHTVSYFISVVIVMDIVIQKRFHGVSCFRHTNTPFVYSTVLFSTKRQKNSYFSFSLKRSNPYTSILVWISL